MPGKLTIRETRGLVLVLLILTALVTAGTYYARARYRASHRAALPPRVPPNITQSQGFSYSHTEQGRTVFTVKAARVREEDGRSVAEDVEIITYGSQGKRHDRIYTKECEYDTKAGRMRSQGQVEIELAGLPGELTDPAAKPTTIVPPADSARPSIFVKTSGVSFDEKTGIVTTEQPLEFRFQRGSGRAVGAVYDSRQGTLELKSAVELEAEKAPEGPAGAGGAVRPEAPVSGGAPRSPKAPSAPVFVNAGTLFYARETGQVRAEQVQIQRSLPEANRLLTANHGEMALDKQNRVQTADFTGSVRLNEMMPKTATQEARESHLAGNELHLFFADDVLEHAWAAGGVQLDVLSARDRIESSAQRLELKFQGKESALSQAIWKGGLRMVSTPVGAPGDVRTLTADEAEMLMKPGGKELASGRTWTPGRIEMVPVAAPAGSAPGKAAPAGAGRASAGRRVLTGDSFGMTFGDQNQLRILTANRNVRVESYAAPAAAQAGGAAKPAAVEAAKPGAPRVSTCDELTALFGDKSHQLESLEQKGNFHYQDGEREARADRSMYTTSDEKIQLTGQAGRNPEVWDATTRTTARLIVLDDQNSTGIAEQDVRTVYVPPRDSGSGAAKAQAGQNRVPGPLSESEPVYVKAERMASNSKTGVTRFESAAGGAVRPEAPVSGGAVRPEAPVSGGAVRPEAPVSGGARVRLWQSQSVIEARTLVLDRNAGRLTAEGQVTTVLVESAGGAAPAAGARPPATGGRATGAPSSRGAADVRPITISAESLVYTDNDRRAHYERGVVLRRQESVMKSASLDAYLLAPEEVKAGQSRLERATARGQVEITDLTPSRTRRAAAEIAEYTTTDEKMVLSGGEPYVFDEQSGYTRGAQLTYYLRDDSIFVHGDGSSRTLTEQRVKKRR